MLQGGWWWKTCINVNAGAPAVFHFELTTSSLLSATNRTKTSSQTCSTYSDILCTVHTDTLSWNTGIGRPSQPPAHVGRRLTRLDLAPRESRMKLYLRNQIHFIKLPDVSTNALPEDAAFTRRQQRLGRTKVTTGGGDVAARLCTCRTCRFGFEWLTEVSVMSF